MKTPKPRKEATKSKLNAPISGFIKKANSAKTIKFNVFQSADSKGVNGTSKKMLAIKLQQNDLGNKKENKLPIGAEIHVSNKLNKQNGKKNKMPFSGENTPPAKKSPEVVNVSPKAGGILKKSPKSKHLKASPEVQLGLDIEQFLDKNSVLKKSPKQSPSTTPKSKVKKSKNNIKIPKKNVQPAKLSAKEGIKLSTASARANKVSSVPKTGKTSKNIEEDLVEECTLKNAVNALFKYLNTNPNSKPEIFGDEIPFSLHVNFIKMPQSNRSRISVPHTILGENSDVCLIVADKKGAQKDPEDLVDVIKERLKKCGVGCISEVIPMRQALHENSQFEQKKKFMDRFDYFLVESKLVKIKSRLFNTFNPKKWPVAVMLEPESRMKDNIEKALQKVPVSFKGQGLTKKIQFGHYKMSVENLVENIQAILKDLCNDAVVIGGRQNIRSVFIKCNKSPLFPLYITTKSSNLVKTPKPIVKKKIDEGVEGELTTFPEGIVKVFKDGTVIAKKVKDEKVKKNIKTDDDDTDEEDDDDDDTEEDDDEEEEMEGTDEDQDEEDDDTDSGEIKKNIFNKLKRKANLEESDSDDDEEYLKELQEMMKNYENEAEDDDESEEDDHKQKKSRKEKNKAAAKRKNLKNKKVKKETSSDEEQLEEAEHNFLKELRMQQNEIESKFQNNQKKVKAKKPKLMNEDSVKTNKEKTKNQKKTVQSNVSQKLIKKNKKPGQSSGNSPQRISEGKKAVGKKNANTFSQQKKNVQDIKNKMKKTDDNSPSSKKLSKNQKIKNKKKAAQNSPTAKKQK